MSPSNDTKKIEFLILFSSLHFYHSFFIGLKIITTLLGGGAVNDGIDKVDNGGASPLQVCYLIQIHIFLIVQMMFILEFLLFPTQKQNILAAVLSSVLGAKDPDQVNIMAKQAGEFINIVVNLLDALKTSFSHRRSQARDQGRKDSFMDLGIASVTMLKGFVRTSGTSSEKCMQKYICEANTECNNDVGQNSIYCRVGR